MTQTIALLAERPARSIAVDDVYFTFGDRSLSYDCTTCGSTCCRGFGFSIDAEAELPPLVAARPHLALFVDGPMRPRAAATVRNLPPGCFFLEEDGRCSIHRIDGPQAKPETCRVFPFNLLRLVGDILVVRPHAALCPVDLARESSAGELSSHGRLVAEMQRAGIRAPVHRAATPGRHPRAALALERTIARLAQEFADADSYAPFLAAQIDATREALGGRDRPGVAESAQSAATAFLERSARILGVSRAALLADNRRVTEVVVAATPYLRSLVVFPDAVGGKANQGVGLAPEEIAYMLGAVYVLAILAQETGMGRITFQTVSALLARSGGLLYLLANSGGIVVADRGTHGIDWSRSGTAALHKQYLGIARELTVRSQSRSPRTLETILLEHVAQRGDQRALALNHVAVRLKGRLEPLLAGSAAARTPSRRRKVRAVVMSLLPRSALRMTTRPALACRALFGRRRGVTLMRYGSRALRPWQRLRRALRPA